MSRVATLAIGWAAGIIAAWWAGAWLSPGATAWLSGALLALILALMRPRAQVLMVAVFLAGALRAALAAMDTAQPPALPPGVEADDRAVDTLGGVVTGAMELRGADQRFVIRLATGARVAITAPLAPPVLPGDRVAVIGLLRTPRGYRVPGALDMAALIRARGGELTLRARTVELQERAAERSMWRLPARVQRRASMRMATRGGDERGNAVARAMITGDRSGLDQHAQVGAVFRDAGVAHVLAVSGLHLSVIALLIFAVVRRAWASVPGLAMRVDAAAVAALVAAPAAIGFTMMTGARTSTMRACLVALVVLAAAATVRRCRLVDALGLAALLLMIDRPEVLAEPGFQLSFAAAATLALMPYGRPARRAGRAGAKAGGSAAIQAARLARVVERLLVAMWRLLVASFACTLATAPFTALGFGTVATGGVIGNLLAVPATELIVVPVGVAGSMLAEIWPGGGGALIDVAVAVAGFLARAMEVIAARSPVISVFPPNGWELGGAGLIWTAWAAAARGRISIGRAGALAASGALIIAASYLYTTRLAPAWRDQVRVTFLDVGQGDAAVVELPGGQVWLIDGAGLPFLRPRPGSRDGDDRAPDPDEQALLRRREAAPGALSVAPFLAHRRIRRIDVLVISHPHPDHYAGVRALVDRVLIDEVWVAADYPDEPRLYRDFLAELADRGTRIVSPPLDRPIGRGGATMTALAPRYLGAIATADPVVGLNDNSLVLRLEAAGRTVLFTGDLEHEGEELLVDRYGAALAADVVKVPHHGSRTSSTAPLVTATRPAWSIISCGVANRFGFPAEEVEARWRQAGAEIVRTDRAGAVTVIIEPDGALAVFTVDPP